MKRHAFHWIIWNDNNHQLMKHVEVVGPEDSPRRHYFRQNYKLISYIFCFSSIYGLLDFLKILWYHLLFWLMVLVHSLKPRIIVRPSLSNKRTVRASQNIYIPCYSQVLRISNNTLYFMLNMNAASIYCFVIKGYRLIICKNENYAV